MSKVILSVLPYGTPIIDRDGQRAWVASAAIDTRGYGRYPHDTMAVYAIDGVPVGTLFAESICADGDTPAADWIGCTHTLTLELAPDVALSIGADGWLHLYATGARRERLPAHDRSLPIGGSLSAAQEAGLVLSASYASS